MAIKDRLTRGFIAGLIAGIPMNILSYILFSLGLTELRFVDWTSIILFGTMTPPTLLSHGLFLTAHLIFTGILGVIFAYLIQSITAKNYYFKGWLYSVAVWLMSYAVSRLLPPFQVIINSPITPLINLINATLFGLILAWALKWLDNKEKIMS